MGEGGGQTGHPAVGVLHGADNGRGLEVPGGDKGYDHQDQENSKVNDRQVAGVLGLLFALGVGETERHLERRHKAPKAEEETGEGGEDQEEERQSVGVEKGESSAVEEVEVAYLAVVGFAVCQTF